MSTEFVTEIKKPSQLVGQKLLALTRRRAAPRISSSPGALAPVFMGCPLSLLLFPRLAMRTLSISYVRVLCMNEIELANNIDTISRTGNTILTRILLDPKMNYELCKPERRSVSIYLQSRLNDHKTDSCRLPRLPTLIAVETLPVICAVFVFFQLFRSAPHARHSAFADTDLHAYITKLRGGGSSSHFRSFPSKPHCQVPAKVLQHAFITWAIYLNFTAREERGVILRGNRPTFPLPCLFCKTS